MLFRRNETAASNNAQRPPSAEVRPDVQTQAALARQDKEQRQRSRAIQAIYLREKYPERYGTSKPVVSPPSRAPAATPPVPDRPKDRVSDHSSRHFGRRADAAAAQQRNTEAAAAGFLVFAAAAAATAVERETTASRRLSDQWRRRQEASAHLEALRRAEQAAHRMRPRPAAPPASEGLRHLRASVASLKAGRVGFSAPLVTDVRSYDPSSPAVTMSESMCADSGCSAMLLRQSTAAKAGLPNLGASRTRVRTASGHVSPAIHATKVPFGLGAGDSASVMRDDQFVNSLCGINKFADAGLITIFHPGKGGVPAYRHDDVNITYRAPPIVEGYREITEAGPRLWRIPLRQPRAQQTAGYSFAARMITFEDIERAL